MLQDNKSSIFLFIAWRPTRDRGLHSFESFSFVIIALSRFISYHGRRKGKVGSPAGKTWRTSNRRNKKHKRSENYSQTHRFRRYHVEPFEWANIQGHPTELFLTISVLQRKFCWLETEVSVVLLRSKVLNLRSRIYQMYQKFLLQVFYPSHLLEIFLGCISSWLLFARELCARMIYLPLIKKSASGHPLLEIRNQATLRHWITGITRNLAVFPGGTVQWRLGRFMRFMFMQKVRFLWIYWIYCLLLCMHVIFNPLVLLICMWLNAIKIASRFLWRT